MKIRIYQDYMHNNGVIEQSLRRHFLGADIAFCDAGDLAMALTGTDILVMPGGADLFYVEKLQGAGNAAIRAWVEGGGTYFGICAGAYYACRHIAWRAGDQRNAIVGSRELKLLDADAAGPVPAFTRDGNDNTAPLSAAAAALIYDHGDTDAFYWGGPQFLIGNDNGSVKILARYAGLNDNTAAVVEFNVGRGRVILSSPHPEIGGAELEKIMYRHQNEWHDDYRAIAARLNQSEAALSRFRAFLYDRVAGVAA